MAQNLLLIVLTYFQCMGSPHMIIRSRPRDKTDNRLPANKKTKKRELALPLTNSHTYMKHSSPLRFVDYAFTSGHHRVIYLCRKKYQATCSNAGTFQTNSPTPLASQKNSMNLIVQIYCNTAINVATELAF